METSLDVPYVWSKETIQARHSMNSFKGVWKTTNNPIYLKFYLDAYAQYNEYKAKDRARFSVEETKKLEGIMNYYRTELGK